MELLSVGMALRALLLPNNRSVLHVVGFKNHPRLAFARVEMVQINVSEAGFARLAERLDATFTREEGSDFPVELGPGLYGPSLFFRANGAFHLFHVCNHWVADLLNAAGLPTTPVLATLPSGLILDLEWRAGVARCRPLRSEEDRSPDRRHGAFFTRDGEIRGGPGSFRTIARVDALPEQLNPGYGSQSFRPSTRRLTKLQPGEP